MNSFWQSISLVFEFFLFVAYMIVLFHIIVDLFRNHETSGFTKALWIVGLIFIPLITAILYIIVNGGKMARRQQDAVQRAKSDTDQYIRHVAGKSPADQIADAKALLDAGTISAEDFATLKAKALA